MLYFLPPKNALIPHYIRFFILLLVCVILHFTAGLKLAVIIALSVGLALLICVAMRIDTFYMYIKGDRLIIKSGVFTKRTAAFSNIRLIYLKQAASVIERICGVCNVSLHGYGTHFLFFPLDNEQAKRLIHLCGVEDENKKV